VGDHVGIPGVVFILYLFAHHIFSRAHHYLTYMENVGDYGTEAGKGEGKEKKEKEKESGKGWSLLFRCEVRISSKYTESFNSMDGSIGLADVAKGG
jgi:hypothetical protein